MVFKKEQVELNKASIAWFIFILALPVIGYWYAWRWYVARISNSLEEVMGLLLFVTFLVFVSVKTIISRKSFYRTPLIPLVSMLVVYGFSFAFKVPPIFQAAIALLATFSVIYSVSFMNHPPVSFWALTVISLPVVPSLQFYLGYPVRYLSAFLTVPLLRLNGVSVSQDSTNLLWSDQILQFDAPCSGVTMLWSGLYFSLFMAFVYRFNVANTIASIVFAFVLVLLGNVIRASSLFYLEIGAVSFEAAWLHEAIGSASYVLVMACIVLGLSRYKKRVE